MTVFIATSTTARLEEEARLWEAVSWVSDPQCAWQIVLHCAGPLCHHCLRTVAPSQSRQHAEGHDEGMWKAAERVMGRWPGTAEQQAVARQIATLPMRLGGLGLRSARRMAPAAFWASWADAMPMLSERLPSLTDQIIEHLENGGVGCHCLPELTESTLRLDRSGFQPTRVVTIAGASPNSKQRRAWRVAAWLAISRVFLSRVPPPGDQAHLRSHSGAGASEVLHGAPTSTEFKVEPQLLKTLILERLRLPLDAAANVVLLWTCWEDIGQHPLVLAECGSVQ